MSQPERATRIRRVLLIDDEPDIRRVGQMSLELIGRFDVLLAAGGEEGIALAHLERPDAILLDLMMPGIDGLETLRRLRADAATRAVPVVMMTASAKGREVDRCLDLGACGVLAKPFDPITLPGELRRLVGTPSP